MRASRSSGFAPLGGSSLPPLRLEAFPALRFSSPPSLVISPNFQLPSAEATWQPTNPGNRRGKAAAEGRLRSIGDAVSTAGFLCRAAAQRSEGLLAAQLVGLDAQRTMEPGGWPLGAERRVVSFRADLPVTASAGTAVGGFVRAPRDERATGGRAAPGAQPTRPCARLQEGGRLEMPVQAPQWTEFLLCPICTQTFEETIRKPISLGCGHTVCKMCLNKLHRKACPFDQTTINTDIEQLPVNSALLQLVGGQVPKQQVITLLTGAEDTKHYEEARKCVEELALYLKPLSSTRGVGLNSTTQSVLSRPMQRKLVTLVHCQLVEEEGRIRAMRAARSLGERTVTELILQHQNPQQLSSNLWAAVRARGCQFLGPAMQEEALKLVLLALEDGSALSRKVLVLFVVQRLEPRFPQASKTSIGHVVQLLYRASCFKVTKRDEDSSLMQLKEEFRTYEALRREHDSQIVQIAMEGGLRIAPDQWSSLLYGDQSHKSHMQSIIDKLQTPASFAQSVQELTIALQRTGDPANLNRLRPHLELLANIDPSPGKLAFILLGVGTLFMQADGPTLVPPPQTQVSLESFRKVPICKKELCQGRCEMRPLGRNGRGVQMSRPAHHPVLRGSLAWSSGDDGQDKRQSAKMAEKRWRDPVAQSERDSRGCSAFLPDAPPPLWEQLEKGLVAVKTVVHGLVDFIQNHSKKGADQQQPPQHSKYKTYMCRDMKQKGGCPRGASCTFAHSQEELEKYRKMNKRLAARRTLSQSLTQLTDLGLPNSSGLVADEGGLETTLRKPPSLTNGIVPSPGSSMSQLISRGTDSSYEPGLKPLSISAPGSPPDSLDPLPKGSLSAVPISTHSMSQARIAPEHSAMSKQVQMVARGSQHYAQQAEMYYPEHRPPALPSPYEHSPYQPGVPYPYPSSQYVQPRYARSGTSEQNMQYTDPYVGPYLPDRQYPGQPTQYPPMAQPVYSPAHEMRRTFPQPASFQREEIVRMSPVPVEVPAPAAVSPYLSEARERYPPEGYCPVGPHPSQMRSYPRDSYGRVSHVQPSLDDLHRRRKEIMAQLEERKVISPPPFAPSPTLPHTFPQDFPQEMFVRRGGLSRVPNPWASHEWHCTDVRVVEAGILWLGVLKLSNVLTCCVPLQYLEEKAHAKFKDMDYTSQYSPWSCDTIGSYISTKDVKAKDVMASGSVDMMNVDSKALWDQPIDLQRRSADVKDDDPIIPFGALPTVSRFGVISRTPRTAFQTAGPVQALASSQGAATKHISVSADYPAYGPHAGWGPTSYPQHQNVTSQGHFSDRLPRPPPDREQLKMELQQVNQQINQQTQIRGLEAANNALLLQREASALATQPHPAKWAPGPLSSEQLSLELHQVEREIGKRTREIAMTFEPPVLCGSAPDVRVYVGAAHVGIFMGSSRSLLSGVQLIRGNFEKKSQQRPQVKFPDCSSAKAKGTGGPRLTCPLRWHSSLRQLSFLLALPGALERSGGVWGDPPHYCWRATWVTLCLVNSGASGRVCGGLTVAENTDRPSSPGMVDIFHQVHRALALGIVVGRVAEPNQ
ncbi:RC3H1 protein, partial [Polypterus senegalus]